MPGSIRPKWFGLRPRYKSGWGHATISITQITIYFTMHSYKLYYCFQTTNVSVLIAFFSSLSTKHNWHHNHQTMAAAGGNGPLAPHMRPCTMWRCLEWMGNNPPSLRMYFWGCWGCVWPSKCSFVPVTMNCHNIGVFWGPYTPSTAPKIIVWVWRAHF